MKPRADYDARKHVARGDFVRVTCRPHWYVVSRVNCTDLIARRMTGDSPEAVWILVEDIDGVWRDDGLLPTLREVEWAGGMK